MLKKVFFHNSIVQPYDLVSLKKYSCEFRTPQNHFHIFIIILYHVSIKLFLFYVNLRKAVWTENKYFLIPQGSPYPKCPLNNPKNFFGALKKNKKKACI